MSFLDKAEKNVNIQEQGKEVLKESLQIRDEYLKDKRMYKKYIRTAKKFKI